MVLIDFARSAVRNRRKALRSVVWGTCIAVCVAWGPSPAWAQYEIDWFKIAGGAAQLSDGTYTIEGTIGQPDAGELTGDDYVLGGGFWRGGAIVPVGVDDDIDEPAGRPLSFRLHTAVPNPSIRGTTITFDLPEMRLVRVHVFDVAGRVTRTLIEESLPAGRHQRSWDGTDNSGAAVEAGIYFVLLDTSDSQARQKVVVLR